MNIVEHVMLVSESNYYIPTRYMIMEAQLGATIATSNVWLKCISHGIETKENFDAYAQSLLVSGSQIADKSLLTGTINEYIVTTLNQVVKYNKGHVADMQTSPYPVG